MQGVVAELCVGGGEVFARAFHFDGDAPRPEVVKVAVVPVVERHTALKRADGARIVHAEDGEQCGDEALRVGFFVSGVLPAFGKGVGVGLYLVPVEHGSERKQGESRQ